MECIPYKKIWREKNPPYLSRFYFYFIFYSLGHKLIRTSFAGRQRGFGYTVFEMQQCEEGQTAVPHRPKCGPKDQGKGQAHSTGTRFERLDYVSTQRLWILAQSPEEGHSADEEAQGLNANVQVI